MRAAARSLVVFVCGCLAYGQAPVIDPDGVLHAATYYSWDKIRVFTSALIPGGLIRILGSNLAAGEARANATPLPTVLLGTQVTINGLAAPLLSVSPREIVLQCPRQIDLSAFKPIPVVVTTANGSAAVEAVFGERGFGIFTLANSACGRGMLYTVRGAGGRWEWVLVDREHSAEPGGEVVLLGTGVGHTIPIVVEDGVPAPAEPLARADTSLVHEGAFLGDSAISAGEVLFAGRAPGLVGVDQYNIRLRSDVPEGCDLPFWIRGLRSASQAVPISIRRGGGPCVEPTPLSYGSFRWQKTVSTGTPVPLDGEELVVDFSRNPLRVEPLTERLYPRPTSFWLESTVMPGPRCPVMDDIVRRLNVGDLRLWFYFPGGAEPLRFSPDLSTGQPVYRVPLPEGTIRPGRFGVEATGSNEVEPFLTQVEIPGPIRVTTDLRAGLRFVTPSMFFPPPIRITWDGGDPQSAVMVTLREPSRSPVGWNTYNFRSWTVLASRGEVTITPRFGTFDIDVWNYREGESGATFSTRGLDTPGRHGWRYQFIYADLGYVLRTPGASGN